MWRVKVVALLVRWGHAADSVRSATGTEAFIRGNKYIAFVAPQILRRERTLMQDKKRKDYCVLRIQSNRTTWLFQKVNTVSL